MRRSVSVITQPAIEPVTLDEAKNYARIDVSDDDQLIAAYISAARDAAEQYTRRSFITKTLKLSLDLQCSETPFVAGTFDAPITSLYSGLPSVISLSHGRVQSISSVVTYDLTNAAATYSAANYTLNSGRLILNYGAIWPSNIRQYGGCEITYVAGYGSAATDVPQAIRTAILMHVQEMYDSRLICDMPPRCVSLLRQFRIMAHA
jgi:hypothetical protein